MPLYEFECNNCEFQFELKRSISEKDNTTCPKCKSSEVSQMFSSFYIMGGSASSCSSCEAASCDTCSVRR